MTWFRPYAAVLLDSFHAALSSRILWCAFAAIWVLLAALSPILSLANSVAILSIANSAAGR